jgi:PAS domain S-box-containing protein
VSTEERDAELSDLRQRLAEAEETLRAIYHGAVDALVVRGPDGPQLFTLRGAQEPYRVLVERMNEGALTVSAEGIILYSNRHFAELVACPLEQIVGKPLAAFVPLRETGGLELLLGDGMRRSLRRELTLIRADREHVPTLASVGPLMIEETQAILMIVTDLTAQKQSEEVAAAERFARSILEQATDAVFVCDAGGRITKASWAAERLLDRPLVGRGLADAVPLDIQESDQAQPIGPSLSADGLLRTLRSGKSYHGIEVRLRTEALSERHFLMSAGPLYGEGSDSIGSIITLTDISERKRAEEHKTVLVAELNHRVKNILAIVQSVAWQTVAGSQSLGNFKQAFDGRLKAISLAHDILTRVRWGQVGLDDLIAQSIAPYAGAARVSTSGPALLLPSHVVVPFAMILHELATNAAKYGAFASEAGRLTIGWDLLDDGRMVRFAWAERGGPPVKPKVTTGFGSKLISRVISYDLHGHAELDFEPEGFRCSLTFPMPAVREEPIAADEGARASG